MTRAVKSSCFVFNHIYYKQIEGVAMGSLLGSTFANLFLVYYEQTQMVRESYPSV